MMPGCVSRRSPISQQDLDAARNRLRPRVTESERDDFIEDCLRDRGSAAYTRKPTGGFEGSNVRPSDEAAMTACVEESFQRWPNPPAPSSRADYEVLYNLYLRETECLRNLGFEVDPPSLDAYIDHDGFWIPYDDLPPPSGLESWTSVNEACPQNPWAYEGDLSPSPTLSTSEG